MRLDKFYDVVRQSLTLTSENVRGFDFLILEGVKYKLYLHDLAYILATVFHETAGRMQPIAEYGKGRGHPYGKPGKYGQAQYGRGYVQLTWDKNYERADRELKLGGRLLRDFDLALNRIYAVQILFKGMEQGWFTGKKLRDYIDLIDEPDKEDQREFANARHVVNGTDKQILISTYALIFEKALKAGEYGKRGSGEVTHVIVDDPGVSTPNKDKTSVAPLPASKWGWLLDILRYLMKGGKK